MLLGDILFMLGIFSLVKYRYNIVRVLISIELSFLGVFYNFMRSAVIIDDGLGILISLIMLGVTASESAVALGMIILYYNVVGSSSYERLGVIQC